VCFVTKLHPLIITEFQLVMSCIYIVSFTLVVFHMTEFFSIRKTEFYLLSCFRFRIELRLVQTLGYGMFELNEIRFKHCII